ncbi:hypothetical protein ACTWPT_55335 [Nonomuraea sp. 3N208]|uniref:hypothetical protein n=1 Tax=Nonomuraea sp. 3N208 TaxID=3457421 RepID=UPI003FD38120
MTHDGDAGVPGSLARVLADVTAERAAQDERWGMQELPDGTGGERTAAESDLVRDETDSAAPYGEDCGDEVPARIRDQRRHVLAEEVLEAFAETDPGRLRAELIQVAAVAVKWTQALDRRPSADGGSPVDRGPSAEPSRFRAIVDVHLVLVRSGPASRTTPSPTSARRSPGGPSVRYLPT